MIEIRDKSMCVGCTACMSVCPKKCISMHEDTEGFVYPSVDNLHCIGCNLCVAVCPVIHPTCYHNQPKIVKAACSNHEEDRMESSSGGVFSLLSEQILLKAGEVWGAAFDEDWRVSHMRVTSMERLAVIRGAKYVQSNLGESFRTIKQSLDSGKWVLFSGTPCQVTGLKRYLHKDYERLLLVDVVCHGVPSYKVFRSFLKEEFGHKSITSVSFRDKTTGWKKYNLCVHYNSEGEDGVKRFTSKANLYMYGFISNLYLRPSCYSCKFKGCMSGSDITLGDFWGIDNVAPEMDDDKGTSLVLTHTEKGKQWFEMVSSLCRCKELPYLSAYQNNKSLEQSSLKNPWRSLFFKDLDRKFFSQLLWSFERPSLLSRIRLRWYSLFNNK